MHVGIFRFWDRNGASTAAEGHRNDRYITVTKVLKVLKQMCCLNVLTEELCVDSVSHLVVRSISRAISH